mgnify:FL=1
MSKIKTFSMTDFLSTLDQTCEKCGKEISGDFIETFMAKNRNCKRCNATRKPPDSDPFNCLKVI